MCKMQFFNYIHVQLKSVSETVSANENESSKKCLRSAFFAISFSSVSLERLFSYIYFYMSSLNWTVEGQFMSCGFFKFSSHPPPPPMVGLISFVHKTDRAITGFPIMGAIPSRPYPLPLPRPTLPT